MSKSKAPQLATRGAAKTTTRTSGLRLQPSGQTRGRYGCWYGCGPVAHEPPCPYVGDDDQDDNQFHCDRCLSFDYGERERLETCRDDRRCPLARRLAGGVQS